MIRQGQDSIGGSKAARIAESPSHMGEEREGQSPKWKAAGYILPPGWQLTRRIIKFF
jgi:hypothetical protein